MKIVHQEGGKTSNISGMMSEVEFVMGFPKNTYKSYFLARIALASRSKADCRRGDGDGGGGQFCRACIEAWKKWKN